MIEIKSLYLQNYRIFNDVKKFDLPPITILTGINSSGKSSVIKALSLLKNIDFRHFPSTIRFDKDKSNSLTFDLIKNNSSSEKSILFGYKIYNTFLGTIVNVFLTLEKKNDFEGVVKHIQIETQNKVILMFDFVKDSRISTYVDLKFFNDNLNTLVTLKEKYGKFEENLISDDEFPSSYYIVKESFSTRPFLWDETTKKWRDLTDEEISRKTEEENIREKEFIDFRSTHPISKSERKWLKDFFESGRQIAGEFPLADKWNKLVGKVRSGDVLFNHPLLTKLLNFPTKDLNYETIKKEITDYISDNGLNIDDEVLERSVNEIISNLLLHSYNEIENKVLIDNQLVQEAVCYGEPFADDIEWSISRYVESVFSLSPFYELFNPAELRMVPMGATPFGKYPDNLSNLEDYITLVFKKIKAEVSQDIGMQVQIPLSSLSVDRIIDFNLHTPDNLTTLRRSKLTTSELVF